MKAKPSLFPRKSIFLTMFTSNLEKYTLEPFHLDESIQNIVRQARLQRLEKEFRSYGSIVDDRQLHHLEEPPAREKTSSIIGEQMKFQMSLRRKGVLHDEMKFDSDTAINNLKRSGHDFTKEHEEYKDEETIWQSKSSDPKYFVRRRYDHPELQAFFDHMTGAEKKKFREQAFEAVIHLARKCRQEVEKEKTRMDEAGIFHPNANAHRAHCIYLLRLHRRISAEAIEDPILRALKKQKDMERESRDIYSPSASPNHETTNNQFVEVKVVEDKKPAILPQLKGLKKQTASSSMKRIEKMESGRLSVKLVSPKSKAPGNQSLPISPTKTAASKSFQKLRRKVTLSPNSMANEVESPHRFWKGSANEQYEVTRDDRRMLKWMKTQIMERQLMQEKEREASDGKKSLTNMRKFKGNPLATDIPDNIDFDTFYGLYQEYQTKEMNDDADAFEIHMDSVSSSSINLNDRRVHPNEADHMEDMYAYDRRKFPKKPQIIPPTIIKRKKLTSIDEISDSDKVKDVTATTDDDDEYAVEEEENIVIGNIAMDPNFILFTKTIAKEEESKLTFKPTIQHVKAPIIKNISLLGKGAVEIDRKQLLKDSATGFINHFVKVASYLDDQSECGSTNTSRRQSILSKVSDLGKCSHFRTFQADS
jgi:hypothetical protein